MTDKKTEALKLALEALKQIDEAMPFPVAKLAQQVIREALAEQPAQQQEPVAWRTKNATPPGGYVLFQQYPQAVAELGGEIEPLYTSPPASKPWVGLTNQELIDLTAIYSGAPLYCAIEAKLREKNT